MFGAIMEEVTVQFVIRLPYTIKKDGDWYVSSCCPLDVLSQGKTEKEAKKNLQEAVQEFLTVCFEMGTLDQVLKECGFSLIEDKKQPVQKFNRHQSMNIPLNFSTPIGNRQACHA